MNPSLLYTMILLSAQPTGEAPSPIYSPSPGFAAVAEAGLSLPRPSSSFEKPELAPEPASLGTWEPLNVTARPALPRFPIEPSGAVVRGQTPGYEEIPRPGAPTNPNGGGPPTYAPGGGTLDPYQPAPLSQDPFLTQPPGVGPSLGPRSRSFAFGTNGPQPFDFGWTVRQDYGFLPKEPTEGNLGNFGISEFDTELEYTTALPIGWIFSATQQFNLRLWDGPLSERPASIGLPGAVHRFGWDLEVATAANRPWSLQLAFNPSLNSDFERSPSSEAWNFDGRGIAFYRVSPSWMIALGAGFWDRVEDRVIPYSGVVWTPDDRWELRLLFPQSRISYFWGTPWGIPTWIYARGQYHIEAYEIEVERVLGGAGRKDQIEIEDWRILLGLRTQGRVSAFLEAGWVFGRDVELRNTPGFNISSGFITRAGIRF